MVELSKKQIKNALDEAYRKAGHNAYFGNGFEAGVEFALTELKKLPIHDVIGRSELFTCHCCATKHSGQNDDQVYEICSDCFNSI
jgi:hypothetical protein